MTPRNENAFSRKVDPHPTAATRTPPSAGPTALATLKPAEFSATAEACCLAGTNSGVIACHAGSFITAPRPSRKVNNSSTHGPTQLVRVIMPSVPEARTIHPCVSSRNRRRSTMSASAPAGRITKNTGNAPAACTSPIIRGFVVIRVISQPAPTFCIQVPV